MQHIDLNAVLDIFLRKIDEKAYPPPQTTMEASEQVRECILEAHPEIKFLPFGVAVQVTRMILSALFGECPVIPEGCDAVLRTTIVDGTGQVTEETTQPVLDGSPAPEGTVLQ